VPTLPSATNYLDLIIRAQGPGAGTADAYEFGMVGANAEFYRVDNDVYTLLGAAVTAVGWAAGDKIGFEASGTSLTGYRHNGASWSSVGSRTDATYGSAGYIGIYIDRQTGRFDNFGGGTIVAASTVRMLASTGVGK
jgi:hypothetical protein